MIISFFTKSGRGRSFHLSKKFIHNAIILHKNKDMEISTQYRLSPEQYRQQRTDKKQIVIHHTVSGPGVTGDVGWWNSTPERVGTAYVIDRDGTIYNLFDDEYWACHLGLSSKHFQAAHLPYRNLDSESVAIELDNWGPVEADPGTGVFYPKGKIRKAKPVKYVYEYCYNERWKGHTLWEAYTTAQLQALGQLLKYLCEKYNIPKTYNREMWTVSAAALKGSPGIWSHCSYRNDKSDCHPQHELIKTIREL